MKYISLFSGIGGLEDRSSAPKLCCEIDTQAAAVLRKRYAGLEIVDDVIALVDPPKVDIVSGGWPCQDISVAGLRRGLAGERSGLFFELLRVARSARAHTIVAENVPNLLRLEGGLAFDAVLAAFEQNGFPFVAWRVLNAREFGLPHDRRRVFIVASRFRESAIALHRPIPKAKTSTPSATPQIASFYWTAGSHSICYSRGYVPTLKVGSSLSVPSPPALHMGDTARLVRPDECAKLQGFDANDFDGWPANAVYRFMGNAVALPVGQWVMESPKIVTPEDPSFVGFGFVSESGLYESGLKRAVGHAHGPLADNLADYVDLEDRRPMSRRAASGLLRRLARSGKPCPSDLREVLVRLSNDQVIEQVADAATTLKAAVSARSKKAMEDLAAGQLSIL